MVLNFSEVDIGGLKDAPPKGPLDFSKVALGSLENAPPLSEEVDLGTLMAEMEHPEQFGKTITKSISNGLFMRISPSLALKYGPEIEAEKKARFIDLQSLRGKSTLRNAHGELTKEEQDEFSEATKGPPITSEDLLRYGKALPKGIGIGAAESTAGLLSGVEWLIDDLPGPQSVVDFIHERAEDLRVGADVISSTIQDKKGFEGFVAQAGSVTGSMGMFLIPGGITQKAIGRISTIAPKVAQWTGASLMASMEALTEAGSVWDRKQKLAERMGNESPKEAADRAAFITFWSNIPILLITDKLSFFLDDATRLKRTILAGPFEAGQEAWQEGVSTKTVGDPLDPLTGEKLKSAAFWGLFGGTTGGAAKAMLDSAVNEARQAMQMPADVKAIYDGVVTGLEARGVDSEQAHIAATRAIARTKQGREYIEKVGRAAESAMATEAFLRKKLKESKSGANGLESPERKAVKVRLEGLDDETVYLREKYADKPRMPESMLDRDAAVSELISEVQDPVKKENLVARLKEELLGNYGVTTKNDLKQVLKELDDSSVPYTYVAVDVGNMGGLNTHHKEVHSTANKDIRTVFGEIWANEVREYGGIVARFGGDELREVWPYYTVDEVKEIRADIERQIRSRAKELGLSDLIHKEVKLPTGSLYSNYGIVEGSPGKYERMEKQADELQGKAKQKYYIEIAENLGYTFDEDRRIYVNTRSEQEVGSSSGREPGGDIGIHSKEPPARGRKGRDEIAPGTGKSADYIQKEETRPEDLTSPFSSKDKFTRRKVESPGKGESTPAKHSGIAAPSIKKLNASVRAAKDRVLPRIRFANSSAKKPQTVIISGKEIGVGSTLAALRHKAREFAKKYFVGKEVTNEDTGMQIRIATSGIKKTLSHSCTVVEVKSIAAIPDLLKKSVYLRGESDRKGRKDMKVVHKFAGAVSIEGKDYDVVLVVREVSNGIFYYDHILIKE